MACNCARRWVVTGQTDRELAAADYPAGRGRGAGRGATFKEEKGTNFRSLSDMLCCYEVSMSLVFP